MRPQAPLDLRSRRRRLIRQKRFHVRTQVSRVVLARILVVAMDIEQYFEA